MEWRCLAMTPSTEENTLCLFLVPRVFFRRSSTSEDTFDVKDKLEDLGGEGEKKREEREEEEKGDEQEEKLSSEVFFFPLLLLHCDQDILLDPDPATPTPPSLLPDLFQHLSLALSRSPSPSFLPAPQTTPIATPTPSPQTSIDASAVRNSPDTLAKLYSTLANESLCELVSRIRAIHFSSYLHAIRTTLAQKQPVPSSGFRAAVDICGRMTVALDCTPLVGALCRHSRLSLISSLSREGGRPTDRDTSEIVDNTSLSTVPAEEQNTQPVSEISTDGAATEENLPFVPETLARLIQRASSRSTDPLRSSSYRLELVELLDEEEEEETIDQVPHCIQWEGELQRVFLDYLSETGFEKVPDCPGYYWLRGEDPESPRKAKKLSRGSEGDGEGLGSPPSEASTIKRKHSITMDNSTLQNEESGMEPFSPHQMQFKSVLCTIVG